jgi:type III secretion protein J
VLLPVESSQWNNSTEPKLASFLGLWLHPQSLSAATWLVYGLVTLVLALAAALVFVVWRQRQDVYPLRPATQAKTS